LLVYLAVETVDAGRNEFKTEDLLNSPDLEDIYVEVRYKHERLSDWADPPDLIDPEEPPTGEDDSINFDEDEDWEGFEPEPEFPDELTADLDKLESIAIHRKRRRFS
jgi:hypothetical protein